MAVKLIVAALALLSTASIAARAEGTSSLTNVEPATEDNLTYGGCKSTTETVGPCSVHFSVCYGFHKRKWRYTATACASGICGSSGHTKSGKGAAEDAAKALFAMGPACASPSQVEGFEARDPASFALTVPAVIVLEETEEAYDPLTSLGCKKASETVGPCKVEFKVCYGFHKFKWRYTATACASGICGSSGHTKSAKGAAEDAAKALFAKGPACAIPPQIESLQLDAPDAEDSEELDGEALSSINCKSASETIGPCKVSFKVCGSLHKLHKWRYHATACASGICASSGQTKSGKGAAEEAAKRLFAMGPACAIPPQVADADAAIDAEELAAPPKMKGSLRTASVQLPLLKFEIDAPADDQLGGSCKHQTEQVATCSVDFKVCYGFYKRKWRYTATACASGICGSSGHTKSGKGAAEEAAKNLFAQGPACAVPRSA